MENRIRSTLLFTALACIVLATLSYSCNEQVCASIVSKCMLTQSCKCDLKNCSCCKECFNCLSYLYSECCSCVELCPKPNETRNSLNLESLVGLLDAVPGLFQAITDGPDAEEKWTIFSFPVDVDSSIYGNKMDHDFNVNIHTADQKIDTIASKDILTVNCTVAFMSQCLPWTKCKQNCQSMGAANFRWFHNGCCECVGSTCHKYGVDDSRCINCPEQDDMDLEFTNEDELDYGEGDGIDTEIESTNQ